MHFCEDAARGNGRESVPVKTSLKGTIPALVNRRVGSFLGNQRGTGHHFVTSLAEERQERFSKGAGLHREALLPETVGREEEGA